MNDGPVAVQSSDGYWWQMSLFGPAIVGKRLTYKSLIASEVQA